MSQRSAIGEMHWVLPGDLLAQADGSLALVHSRDFSQSSASIARSLRAAGRCLTSALHPVDAITQRLAARAEE